MQLLNNIEPSTLLMSLTANMRSPIHIVNHCKSELKFTTSRSGGSGGQHVNKVETKVTLRWNIGQSLYLDEEQKTRILTRLSRYVNQNGEFILYHQTERSQLLNKEMVVKKWIKLIHEAFFDHKPRRHTKPSKGAIAARRRSKEKRSAVKSLRRKPRVD